MDGIIIREYFCEKCDMTYETSHCIPNKINTHCMSCGNPIQETGITKTVEGEFIVVRHNDKFMKRYLRGNLKKLKE